MFEFSSVNLNQSFPKGVAGAMDGERPPMSKIEEMKQRVDKTRQSYGHYLSGVRPWREFVYLSKPQGDVSARLEANLSNYKMNYAILFVLLTVWSIVKNPWCLVACETIVRKTWRL